MTSDSPAIKTDHLVKCFASGNDGNTTTRALDDISLTIPRGCICGLLGPNGAGKTTFLRIVNNILAADSGEVEILGQPVSMEHTSPLVGYMPEERGLYDRMRIEDQIMYFGLLKGGRKERLREVMNEYLQLFNLADDKRRRIKELSKGNQQKVQIVSTLVHEPEIVMLDEPFSGFDPINGELLRELIDRLHQKGTTIMLSSHNMDAVEKMCDRIAMINHGRIMLDGNLEEIKEGHRDGSITVTTRGPLHLPLLESSGVVADVKEVPVHGRHGHSYRIHKNQGKSNAELLQTVAIQGDIVHFEENLPTLNDIFLQYAK